MEFFSTPPGSLQALIRASVRSWRVASSWLDDKGVPFWGQMVILFCVIALVLALMISLCLLCNLCKCCCSDPEPQKAQDYHGTVGQVYSPGTNQISHNSLRHQQYSASNYNTQPYDKQVLDYDQYGGYEPQGVDSNTALLLQQNPEAMGTFGQDPNVMFVNSPHSSKTQRTGSGRNETPKLQNFLNQSMPAQNHNENFYNHPTSPVDELNVAQMFPNNTLGNMPMTADHHGITSAYSTTARNRTEQKLTTFGQDDTETQ